MKKMLVLLLVATFCANVFAAPFGDLFGTSKSEVVTGALPNGREILPALWAFTHQEFKSTDKKVIKQTASLEGINVIDNEYKLSYKIYFKFGIGLQSQESILKITSDGQNFFVQTMSMKTYAVDKNLNHQKNSGGDNAVSTMNQNSKNFVKTFEDMLSSFSEDEYNKWNEESLYDLETQLGVTKYAANKLKMKRWYEAHPLKGKEVTIPFFFTSIDDAKQKDFKYELVGLCGLADTVVITIYSNNDEYIDTKDRQALIVTGTVREVKYKDEATKYKIAMIYIDEKKN